MIVSRLNRGYFSKLNQGSKEGIVMSLVCDETGKDIEFGDPLFVGSRWDADFYAALSWEVLKNIPSDDRRTEPCDINSDGVDIYVATSKRNFNGSYTVTTGFKKLDFVYSISRTVAEKYLPNHIKRYHQA